jgi:hypothetical protein
MAKASQRKVGSKSLYALVVKHLVHALGDYNAEIADEATIIMDEIDRKGLSMQVENTLTTLREKLHTSEERGVLDLAARYASKR